MSSRRPKREKADKFDADEPKKDKQSGSALSSGTAGHSSTGGGGAPRNKKAKLDYEETSWGGPPIPAPLDVMPQPVLPIHHVAGRGEAGFCDGPCNAACFQGPAGIALTSDGCILVADSDNRRLRKIILRPVECEALHDSMAPTSLDGKVGAGRQMGDQQQRTPEFRAVTTLAGTGQWGVREGRGATLCDPCGVVSDASGNVFVTDAGSHSVRRVSANGEVAVLAGSGKPGYADGHGNQACFAYPYGIAIGPDGTI